jgi:hypothetical protein
MKKMITVLSAIGLIGVVSSSVVACDPVGDKARKEISDHALDKYLTNTDLGEFEFNIDFIHGQNYEDVVEKAMAPALANKIIEMNINNPNVVDELTTRQVITSIDKMSFMWGEVGNQYNFSDDGTTATLSVKNGTLTADFIYYPNGAVTEEHFFSGKGETNCSFTIKCSSEIFRRYTEQFTWINWTKDIEKPLLLDI